MSNIEEFIQDQHELYVLSRFYLVDILDRLDVKTYFAVSPWLLSLFARCIRFLSILRGVNKSFWWNFAERR